MQLKKEFILHFKLLLHLKQSATDLMVHRETGHLHESNIKTYSFSIICLKNTQTGMYTEMRGGGGIDRFEIIKNILDNCGYI